MNTYISLFLLAWVLTLVGYLWLAIVAFKRSIPWGILVLLFSPISAIAFSFTNWFDARKAFILYIASFLLFGGSAVKIYGEVGMGNMQQITARLHSGKLAPNQAYALIQKALAHDGPEDLFADETDVASVDASMPDQNAEQGSTNPAQATSELAQVKEQPVAVASKTAPTPVPQAVPQPEAVAPVAKNEPDSKVKTDKTDTQAKKAPEKTSDKSKVTTKTDTNKAKHIARIPSPENAQPDPLAQKPFKPKPNTRRVSIDRLTHYIGRYLIIKLKAGNEQRGLLRKVTSRTLILDRKLYGGNIKFRISKREIRSVHVLTRLPDER